jgi:baculoviral IAP repeat-containing protein 6
MKNGIPLPAHCCKCLFPFNLLYQLTFNTKLTSKIFVSLPYFNEPGYEASMGTPQGTKASNEYNEVIRQGTAKWAILEQLRNPSPGFEEVIKTHFRLKKDIVLKTVGDWVKDAQSSKTSGYCNSTSSN